jgi:hypothetical protein
MTDLGRAFRSVARRRDWPSNFDGLAGRRANLCVGNELIGTVPLGKRLLRDEPV